MEVHSSLNLPQTHCLRALWLHGRSIGKRFSERRRERGRNRVCEQETVNPGLETTNAELKSNAGQSKRQTFLKETGARTEGVFTQQFVISACADQRRSTFPTAKISPSSPTEVNFALSATSLYLAR